MARFPAEGAYDGSAVIDCLEEAFGAEVEVIIPPPKTAVIGLNDRRDANISQSKVEWPGSQRRGTTAAPSLKPRSDAAKPVPG